MPDGQLLAGERMEIVAEPKECLFRYCLARAEPSRLRKLNLSCQALDAFAIPLTLQGLALRMVIASAEVLVKVLFRVLQVFLGTNSNHNRYFR